MARPEIHGNAEVTVFGEAAKKLSKYKKGEFGLAVSPALERSFDAWGDQDPDEILAGSKEIRGIVRERLGDLTPYLDHVLFTGQDEVIARPKHLLESTEVLVPVGDGKWREVLASELDNPERRANLVIEAAVKRAMTREGLNWTEEKIKALEGKRPTKEVIEQLGRLHAEAAEKENIIRAADAAIKAHEKSLSSRKQQQMKDAVGTALMGMGSARIRTFTPRPSIFDTERFP